MIELNTAYDEKCLQLAQHFIRDSSVRHNTELNAKHSHALAQLIQIAVESYFDSNNSLDRPWKLLKPLEDESTKG